MTQKEVDGLVKGCGLVAKKLNSSTPIVWTVLSVKPGSVLARAEVYDTLTCKCFPSTRIITTKRLLVGFELLWRDDVLSG